MPRAWAFTTPSYGLVTIRDPVPEVTPIVDSFEIGRGFPLRVQRAGKPRHKSDALGRKVGLPHTAGSC